jgi:P27 family predicted phage terminase small subunit
MTRGRKKIPPERNALRGNPGKRTADDNAPLAELCLPEPPKHVQANAEALAAWDYIGEMLYNLGVLAASDAIALEMAAFAYAQYKCTARFMATGLAAEIAGDTKEVSRVDWTRCCLAIAHKQNSEALRKILAELGMTPAARRNVMRLTPLKEADPFDEEFGPTTLKMNSG